MFSRNPSDPSFPRARARSRSGPASRLFAVLLCGCLALGGLSSYALAQRVNRLPNVLIVTFDTTRRDRIGCYGFEGIKTPNIDRLAREGVLFENVRSQAPQTMPNHTSIFTGLYTITHDVRSNGQTLNDEALTLAEILKSAGYQTGAVVAAAPLMKDYNLDQGFDYYNDDFRDVALVGGFKWMMRFFSAKKINIPTSRPANRVAALAREWITPAAKKKRPFFLWLHFFDAHEPYEFHPDFEKPEIKTDDGESNQYGYKEGNYLNEIEFADHYLGKVLKQFDRLGLTENTITVFTADHGESLGEHDYRGHRQNVYENIIRVPLIIRYPAKLPAGERLATPAMSIDILPTVLTLVGIPYSPQSFQGQDLFSLPVDQPRYVFTLAVKLFTKTAIRRSLVYGHYKFIEFDDASKNALFNLEEDPGEAHNLLGSQEPALENVAWIDEINDWFERFERVDFSDIAMTPEQLERLKSLGYVQ